MIDHKRAAELAGYFSREAETLRAILDGWPAGDQAQAMIKDFEEMQRNMSEVAAILEAVSNATPTGQTSS